MTRNTEIIDKIYDFYSQSTNTWFVDNGFNGEFYVENTDKLNLISQIIDENILDIEFLDGKDYFDKSDFSLGKSYTYQAISSVDYINKLIFSTDSFLKKCFENPSNFNSSEYIVITLDQRFGLIESEYKEDFIALTDLITFLSKTYFSTSYKLVIFSDKPLNIPLPLCEGVYLRYHGIFKNSRSSFAHSVTDFLNFFETNNGENNPHRKEKTLITGNIIEEKLNSANLLENVEERIYFLIKEFTYIRESIDKSFNLYIKNFNYQNIIEQFEDKYKTYIDSINSSIKSLQSQVLGLPVLVVATTIDKVSENPLSFFALLAYIVFVSLNLNIQYKNLEHIQILVDKIKTNELPDSIVTGTREEEASLKDQLSLLKRYFFFIIIMLLLVLIYIIINLYRIYY